jgi:hypothetical protein
MENLTHLQDGYAFWKQFSRWLAYKSVNHVDRSLPKYPLLYYVKMWETPIRGSIVIGGGDVCIICNARYHGIDLYVYEGTTSTTIKLMEGNAVTISERNLLRKIAKRINESDLFMTKEG